VRRFTTRFNNGISAGLQSHVEGGLRFAAGAQKANINEIRRMEVSLSFLM
jgi:hypothetical protein